MRINLRFVLIIGAALSMLTPSLFADEGMWLFNNPPRKLLQQKYDFTPTEDWLEHVQKASVRFNNGGSGSFVSPNGLVMTNHHVALDVVEKLSTKEKDLVSTGFYAGSREQELKADALELNVLMSIEDVTGQVKAAVKPGMKLGEAFVARRAAISRIESESEKETGLRSNVITLYQGGQYHLYRFKRYTDVRLVFVPEQQAAFFGGDADNFSYPRYCLDCAFLRVYEDGKPASTPHYFKWSKGGAGNNELVFVSGHPGRTSRLNTVDELKYLRDIGFPYLLQRLYRWEVMASVYSGRSEEHARKAKDFLFSIANSRKARNGGLAGLLSPELMNRKIRDEEKLKAAVARNPELKDVAGAWDTIAKLQRVRAANIRDYVLFEAGAAFNTKLFTFARTVVRAGDAYAKPNEDRLSEFTDSGKKSLELKLFTEQPIYTDFEIAKLGDSITWLCEQVGYESKLVQRVLNGKSPRQRASELIVNSRLNDVKYRRKLYEGGKDAIQASDDPLIKLALLIDPFARKVRNTVETKLDEPKRQAYDLIAKAKFAVEGTDTYPDATFTLRLAFGTVKGYEEDGKSIPFETTFAGLYERAQEQDNRYPFTLPERWAERKGNLNLKTPYNFVCTADIIGGNSGSPVINKNAEIVGLIFDGNIQSLVLDFAYTDVQARAVSVHSEGILEALRSIYEAEALVSEIEEAKR